MLLKLLYECIYKVERWNTHITLQKKVKDSYSKVLYYNNHFT